MNDLSTLYYTFVEIRLAADMIKTTQGNTATATVAAKAEARKAWDIYATAAVAALKAEQASRLQRISNVYAEIIESLERSIAERTP